MSGPKTAGFTLLEVLLSVAIIAALVGVATPVYAGFVQRNDLDIATQSIAAMFNRAATYARASNDDNAWSVDVQAATVTLFEGTNFATRDTSNDETYNVPGSVTLSYTGDVSFAELTAKPNTTISMTLTSNANATRTLTINAKGVVGY